MLMIISTTNTDKMVSHTCHECANCDGGLLFFVFTILTVYVLLFYFLKYCVKLTDQLLLSYQLFRNAILVLHLTMLFSNFSIIDKIIKWVLINRFIIDDQIFIQHTPREGTPGELGRVIMRWFSSDNGWEDE